MNYAIGIDLGGTRIKSARIDLNTGALLATAMLPTRDGERVGDEPAFAVGVRELVARHEREMGCAASIVGISAPGLARRDGSCIYSMPGKLDGIEGLAWRDFLGRPATCLNDAHAALLGEVWQGAAKGRNNVVMLTLGTGVGGAVLCDGLLLRGHLGRAGHLGHISVDMDGPPTIIGVPGGIEHYIGNGTLGTRTGGRFQMTSDLLSAIDAGDAAALAVWQRSLKALGVALVSCINAFDPEIIVIGGGIANAWERIEPSLLASLDAYEWRPAGARVQLIHATLGEWAGCYGAVWGRVDG